MLCARDRSTSAPSGSLTLTSQTAPRKRSRLGRRFYARPTLEVAHDLIGCRIVRRETCGARTSGIIVETEAYIGEDDRACHAYAGLTPRTQVIYGPAGFAYVYLIYGMYHMLNAVTETRGRPGVVLIRSITADEGVERMAARRGLDAPDLDGSIKNHARLTAGPGRLTQALAIDRTLNGVDLTENELFIEEGTPEGVIERTARIGIDYAGVWKRKPWRFIMGGHPFVSGPAAARRGSRVRRPLR